MAVPDTLLGHFANALADSGAFSPELTAKAELCLLDFLTSSLSTGGFAWVRQARQVALANSTADSRHGAAIIGTPDFVSVQDAAFANAVAGHSLVRDDMHLDSVSHLGVVVVPTALALAAREPVSGRQLLDAIICGYEAGCKLGALLMDVETARKFRPTGLIGAFAAAATGARLLGLDARQTANALGFAANYITGLNEWAAWGSDDMYFHPGIAARNGITAMALARAGATAAAGALDGTAGLFAALGKTVAATPALPFAGEAEIMNVFFKQVPACNYAQTAAQAAAEVARQASHEHGLDASGISRVSVHVPYAAAHYPGCDFAGPFTSILQARMSIHFNVASALLHGDFDDSHYRDFGNARVGRLARKICVLVDADLSAAYPASQGARITVNLESGHSLTAHLDNLQAASAAEVRERFLAAATAALGDDKAKRLQAAVGKLADSPDTEFLKDLSTDP